MKEMEEGRAWRSTWKRNVPNYAMSMYKYTTMNPAPVYDYNALINNNYNR